MLDKGTREMNKSVRTGPGATHAHKLVRETAIGMCGELYDTMMQDNEWYATWKRANPRIADQPRQLFAAFLARNLPRVISQARATLASMLTTTTDPELRESIYEALCLDNTLLRGRGPAPGGTIQ